MATYSTNLGLTLIGTGEQSGTWGTTTNTNLGTLLEQSISGYVTQAVSAGTTTLTIPDGADGVARNMFIELTGTGGGSLVVPAKRKLYFIYNNSSAVITVKVTGLTGVAVPATAKMVLVCNGTDIVNALNYFASLSLGTITTTSDSLINGLTIGKGGTSVATNTALGSSALAANTTGAQNVASGINTLLANTTGDFNVALGSGALQTNIGGSYNSAVGANVLASNTTGTQNTGVGSGALYYATSTQNTGVGSGALYGVTTGANNSGFGFQAGYGVTTGSNNVILGSYQGALAPISATGSNYVVLSDGAANVRAYWNGADATFNGALGLTGYFSRSAPVVKTADFTLAVTENWVENNKSAATCVVTLPAAASYVGREVMFKNTQAQTLVSATSNVVPLIGGSAGTAILDASAGAWAVLVSNGTTWTISEASAPATVFSTSGTLVNTTSGTSIDFTSIPTWVKRITVMLSGVGVTPGSSQLQLQIGSGSVDTTGYVSAASQITNLSVNATSSTTGFLVNATVLSTTRTTSGSVTLVSMGSNIWVESGVLQQTNDSTQPSGGTKTLSGVLDRIRLTSISGTETFNAGSMNILMEGF